MTVSRFSGEQNSAYEPLRSHCFGGFDAADRATVDVTSTVVAPPAVQAGDWVGVAALSSPTDPAALERGVVALERMGFRVRLAENVDSQWRMFAGTDEERAAGLHALVCSPEIRAVFFTRGGHGVLRTLPHVDWELLQRHPKAYVGYSDLTPFLLGVVERVGLIAYHGPMVAADLARGIDDEEEASLLGALAGDVEGALPCVGILGKGRAQGRLLGGCLSLLPALEGTPWRPDLTGCVVALEDVGEPLYRIDRMLTQLRLAGRLRAVEGLVLGHLRPTETGAPVDEDTLAFLADLDGGFSGPLAWGVPFGHEAPNLTLPFGARVRLDADEQTFEVLPLETAAHRSL